MNKPKVDKPINPHIKNESDQTKPWEYKPFQHIFHELVNLLELFENSSEQYKITLLNSLMTTNMRLLEGVIDSILYTFPIHKNLYNGLDRLPVKEKFDLALLLKNKQLPRDGQLIEDIDSVRRKRDSLLHPKVKSLLIHFQSNSNSKKPISFNFEKEINPNEKEVKRYLKNTFAFLDQFFLDEVQLTGGEIQNFLLDQVKLDDSTWGTMMRGDLSNDVKKIQEMLNIKIRLLSSFIS